MEYLKLQTNIPVQVAFKYTTGREVQSEFTDPATNEPVMQKMFTLVDGRVVYLPLYPAQRIEEQLAQQNVQPGEDVDLVKAEVKRGNRKGIEYQVKRVTHPPAPSVTAPLNGHASEHSNGNTPAIPQPHPKTKLQDALCTVVAACHAARNYAKEIGYEAMPPFTSEDIRTMANTLMIQNGNGGNR